MPVPGTKVCSKCGKDVSKITRNKDQFGRYYCADCTQTLTTVARKPPAAAPAGRRVRREEEARKAAPATRFSLVLLGRFEGKDQAVAAALARDFGLDDAWGQKVVDASPIIILDELTSEQAEQIHNALSAVEAAGSRFEVQPGADPGFPKAYWSTPPRIKGRPISEYAVSSVESPHLAG
jgi:ribosomal protein L7/L12